EARRGNARLLPDHHSIRPPAIGRLRNHQGARNLHRQIRRALRELAPIQGQHRQRQRVGAARNGHRMTPVIGHGHLRLYLLSLLSEHPMHGYELIQALSDRFGGTYIPCAGTIYPRLAKLSDEGLVTREADGRKTVYSITDAGRAELA